MKKLLLFMFVYFIALAALAMFFTARALSDEYEIITVVETGQPTQLEQEENAAAIEAYEADPSGTEVGPPQEPESETEGVANPQGMAEGVTVKVPSSVQRTDRPIHSVRRTSPKCSGRARRQGRRSLCHSKGRARNHHSKAVRREENVKTWDR